MELYFKEPTFRNDRLYFFRDCCGPVLLEPHPAFLIRYEKGSLLADVLDLLYDVEEYPVALERLADDGCPHHDATA